MATEQKTWDVEFIPLILQLWLNHLQPLHQKLLSFLRLPFVVRVTSRPWEIAPNSTEFVNVALRKRLCKGGGTYFSCRLCWFNYGSHHDDSYNKSKIFLCTTELTSSCEQKEKKWVPHHPGLMTREKQKFLTLPFLWCCCARSRPKPLMHKPYQDHNTAQVAIALLGSMFGPSFSV